MKSKIVKQQKFQFPQLPAENQNVGKMFPIIGYHH